MKTSLKIFIATALGALIGSFIALELNQFLWWLGMLVGGLVGYLSYGFEHVVSATKSAFNKVLKIKIRKETIKFHLITYLMILTFFYNFLIIISLFSVDEILIRISKLNTIFGYYIFLPMFTASFVYLAITLSEINKNEKTLSEKLGMKDSLKTLLFGNPIILPFTCIYFLIKFLFKNKQVIASATRKILIFIFYTAWVYLFKGITFVFIQIHSDMRIICMVGATIGTIIGYLLNSPIIGAVSGGIISILSFHIVSIRILKLEPRK